LDLLARINWVDILALILILRITYIGSFLGIGKQLLPLLSLLLSLTFSVHYYDDIAAFITARSTISTSMAEFVFFVLLVVILMSAFKFLIRFVPIKKPEVLIPIERVGGSILGFFRAGVIFISFLLLPVSGFKESVKASLSGSSVVKISLDFYTNINKAISRRTGQADGEGVSTLSTLAKLTKKKDYEWKLFDFKLRDKARFFDKN
jgi:uncharacterized membrane protein required for colicin V production